MPEKPGDTDWLSPINSGLGLTVWNRTAAKTKLLVNLAAMALAGLVDAITTGGIETMYWLTIAHWKNIPGRTDRKIRCARFKEYNFA